MTRRYAFALLTLGLFAQTAAAQDGPLNRVGRALDNAGKNIRNRVETEVARGQVVGQERDLLHRVIRRIEWDKQLLRSVLQIEAQPGGVIVVRGSVMSEEAKRRTLDLVENTIGVTQVVSELAIAKDVKVTEPVPTQVIVTPIETRVISTPAAVPVPVPAQPPVVVPPPATTPAPKVIVKP